MRIEIPDRHLNALQIDSIRRLLQAATGMHYANVLVRINGADRWFEADWLKHATEGSERVWVTEVEQDGDETLIHLSDGRCASLRPPISETPAVEKQ